jgi:hypothetical protein
MREELEDLSLIENIKNGEDTNDALKCLVARHSGIYYSIVNRFFPNFRRDYSTVGDIDKGFVFDSKEYIIYNSALSFDKNRGTKFSTHLANQARWFCLNHIEKNREFSHLARIDFDYENSVPDEDEDICERIDQSISSKIIEIVKDMPDKRIYDIFRFRYLETDNDKVTPWHKICEKIPHKKPNGKHLTIQGCINLHNKALGQIKKRVKRLRS